MELLVDNVAHSTGRENDDAEYTRDQQHPQRWRLDGDKGRVDDDN
jgi:hypothetical protein